MSANWAIRSVTTSGNVGTDSLTVELIWDCGKVSEDGLGETPFMMDAFKKSGERKAATHSVERGRAAYSVALI